MMFSRTRLNDNSKLSTGRQLEAGVFKEMRSVPRKKPPWRGKSHASFFFHQIIFNSPLLLLSRPCWFFLVCLFFFSPLFQVSFASSGEYRITATKGRKIYGITAASFLHLLISSLSQISDFSNWDGTNHSLFQQFCYFFSKFNLLAKPLTMTLQTTFPNEVKNYNSYSFQPKYKGSRD